MRICLVGLDNLPVLVPEYQQHAIGGESVQQTLLARALVRRGHEVSMIAADYGQPDAAICDGVRVYKAYRPEAGLPLVRFIHPRWTGIWSALARADAELYYTSCAGMHVGLLSLFCMRHGSHFIFRTASDSDCDMSRLLVRYGRDRHLYLYGLRRANAILVQSKAQAHAMACNFDLGSSVAGMLVESSSSQGERDIDVLWVNNIRSLKRPDRVLELAAQLPESGIHMVGGSLPGEEELYENIRSNATVLPNLTFHGRLSYWDTNAIYGRARLLINTSELEGFPNAYLQAWIRGVPVITYIDPDGVIVENGLGIVVKSASEMHDAVRWLLSNPAALAAASARCHAYMAREFAEEKILAPYLAAFEHATRGSCAESRIMLPESVQDV